jgi:hypothetical protein
VRTFQCDLRATAGTDKADVAGLRAAKQRPGRKDLKTAEIYVRNHLGNRITATK